MNDQNNINPNQPEQNELNSNQPVNAPETHEAFQDPAASLQAADSPDRSRPRRRDTGIPSGSCPSPGHNRWTLPLWHRTEYISVRIGIKDNAKNVGGINLFGDCYGDFPQHIKMVIHY